VQQHLQRLDGVDKAEVSLRDGHVTVYPKPGAMIDPARILKATYDSGVSVTEMTMTAQGEMVNSEGAILLRLSQEQSFAVSDNTLAERLRAQASSGRSVAVRARLYRKSAGAAADRAPPELSQIEILEILGDSTQ
jgi:hypothetical protein